MKEINTKVPDNVAQTQDITEATGSHSNPGMEANAFLAAMDQPAVGRYDSGEEKPTLSLKNWTLYNPCQGSDSLLST